jgi:hypothetical protein
MKKILFLILISANLFSQIKIKDLPTTTTGSTGDFLLKDDAAGIPGSTKKISVANFLSTYLVSNIIGSGTTNYIPKFTSSTTIGNSDFYVSGNNFVIPTGKYISGSGLTFSQIDLAKSGTDGNIFIQIQQDFLLVVF